MSISTPLTLDNAAGTAKAFARLSTVAGQSDWIQTDTNLTEPVKLLIRHSVSGSGANAIDRHNVNLTAVKVDSAGVPRALTLNFSLGVPRSAVITTTMVKDLTMQIVNFLTDQADTDGHSAFTNLEDVLIGVM